MKCYLKMCFPCKVVTVNLPSPLNGLKSIVSKDKTQHLPSNQSHIERGWRIREANSPGQQNFRWHPAVNTGKKIRGWGGGWRRVECKMFINIMGTRIRKCTLIILCVNLKGNIEITIKFVGQVNLCNSLDFPWYIGVREREVSVWDFFFNFYTLHRG